MKEENLEEIQIKHLESVKNKGYVCLGFSCGGCVLRWKLDDLRLPEGSGPPCPYNSDIGHMLTELLDDTLKELEMSRIVNIL